ncbi:hypothetical protein ASF12_23410 [Paenibacillus sp. Leaf72]|nr:hypothetical protein ASF12_23410 [Paenibacillus sp. Leaf72]
MKEKRMLISILSLAYLMVFFGTMSWYIVGVFLFGFMSQKPLYLQSLPALGIMVLYVNSFILCLKLYLKFSNVIHYRLQLFTFIGLAFIHYVLWI